MPGGWWDAACGPPGRPVRRAAPRPHIFGCYASRCHCDVIMRLVVDLEVVCFSLTGAFNGFYSPVDADFLRAEKARLRHSVCGYKVSFQTEAPNLLEPISGKNLVLLGGDNLFSTF